MMTLCILDYKASDIFVCFSKEIKSGSRKIILTSKVLYI